MTAPWTLYDDMTKSIGHIFECINKTKNVHDLQHLLFEITRNLHLRHIVYHRINSPIANGAPFLILTYPKEWIRRYFEANYLKIDPVIRSGLSGLMPLDWATINRNTEPVRQFFDEARDYGVGIQGATMTIRGPNQDSALFTFTSDVAMEEWPRLKAAMLPPMLLIGHALHLRFEELQAPDNRREYPKLSPREIECLQYCANGFRDNQTARKFLISEAVVRAYLDSARHKLISPTRPHAIAKAIKLGIIAAPE